MKSFLDRFAGRSLRCETASLVDRFAGRKGFARVGQLKVGGIC